MKRWKRLDDLSSHLCPPQTHWVHLACVPLRCSWSPLAATQGWPLSPEAFRRHLFPSTGKIRIMWRCSLPEVSSLAQLLYPFLILTPIPSPELQPCREHQAFCQHPRGTLQLPTLVAFSSICFDLWKICGMGAPSPDDQAVHGIRCLYTSIGTDYMYTFKIAVIRKWAMKCVSDDTLIICFIA